jgi:hypothetical protein
LHNHLRISLLTLILDNIFPEIEIGEAAHEPLTARGTNLPVEVHHLIKVVDRTNSEVWQRFRLV